MGNYEKETIPETGIFNLEQAYSRCIQNLNSLFSPTAKRPSAHFKYLVTTQSWTSSPVGLKINIGIWFVDGLKATSAFTSEEALFEWAKKPSG